MPKDLTPQKVHNAVREGFKRLRNFRHARLMFMREYVGQYYDRERGDIGTEPLNLIFNAISVLVPNLVHQFPKYNVKSRFVAYRTYGELLGLALDYNAKEIGLCDTLRRWVVDAVFTMGILKTGLVGSSQVVSFGDVEQIDNGMIYTELVDFDDWVVDPATRCPAPFPDAAFLGHRVRISKQQLLDSGLYRNDLVERLPTSGESESAGLSTRSIKQEEAAEFHDFVDLIEIWVPQAKAIITLPDEDLGFDDYLRITDYYGPAEGPYTYLYFAPPVPNNPMPVAPIGIWYDLHIRANRMVAKTCDQADRQKDLIGYRGAAVDDAEEVRDAEDGSMVKMEDPSAVQTFSFGGQQRSNEAHIAQLMMWFDLISGSTDALSGYRMNTNVATIANILQQNSSIRVGDLKDSVYKAVAEEGRKRAWYLHTDPLIEIPLIKRQQVPAQFVLGPAGPIMTQPARIEDVQVTLSPEARQGDFLDFQFEVEPKSMSRVDPQVRFQRMMEFVVKVFPAAAQTMQLCAAMGVPFSFVKFVSRAAKEADIEWLDEVFYDPEFQLQMMQMMMRTPGMANSKAQLGQTPNVNLMPALAQNGQPGNIPAVTTPQEETNQQAQFGANEGQARLKEEMI